MLFALRYLYNLELWMINTGQIRLLQFLIVDAALVQLLLRPQRQLQQVADARPLLCRLLQLQDGRIQLGGHLLAARLLHQFGERIALRLLEQQQHQRVLQLVQHVRFGGARLQRLLLCDGEGVLDAALAEFEEEDVFE